MNAKNELNGIVDLVVPEIHELEEEIDPVPEMIAKQLNEPLFEFRPLTEEEKKRVRGYVRRQRQTDIGRACRPTGKSL